MQSWASELQRFAVGKKIASCLSTVSCQHTLDHLMHETSQLLHETDDPSVTKAFTESASRVRPSDSSSALHHVHPFYVKPENDICAKMSPGESHWDKTKYPVIGQSDQLCCL